MASASAGTRLRQRPLLACASRATRAAHRDAAWSAPVLLLTAEAAGATGAAPRLSEAALSPFFWGFAASGATHGRQLRFRAVTPLSARRLHTVPPGKEAPAAQQGRAESGGAGGGATPGVEVAREVHSSALAAREDSAPPREVRHIRGTRSCVRGACLQRIRRQSSAAALTHARALRATLCVLTAIMTA
jgi:hypothetical protein